MRIVQTIEHSRRARREMGSVALVPTMGALHEGHLSLIRRAHELTEHVVVSIYVNPTQFNEESDFENYPRPHQRDLDLCEREGVDVVFTPRTDQMYPPRLPPLVIDVPELTSDLEAEHRPGHFVGVCRIVAKLLTILSPDIACFGEKDYQQLKVIEAMVAGLCMPVRIEPCPIVRESDALAISSRNVHLSSEHRAHALGLSKALEQARWLIEQRGETDPGAIEASMRQDMLGHHVKVDYAAVRDAHTLRPVDIINPCLEPVVCLVAGHVGQVRLIDNRLMGARS